MRIAFTPIDGLLLLVALIWGSNFSVVKVAIDELSPLGFNALRMTLASALILGWLRVSGLSLPARRDLARLVGLAVVGHFLYQTCFILGLARTSVANGSLILGSAPIAVTLLTWHGSSGRPSGAHWAGVGLSLVGIYLVLGRGARLAVDSAAGDLLMFGAMSCWAIYTVSARPLLQRYSPLAVTAWSMGIGTLLLLPMGVTDLVRLEWASVSSFAWIGLSFSAIFAICLAYLVWYTAVQRIGSARTAIYANMVPVAGMTVAALWLEEPIGAAKIAGATAVILGVVLTKLQPATPLRS